MATTNVLFEIGLEEMPARFLDDAQKQLKLKTKDWLTNLRIPYGQIHTYVTPRRLTVVIEGLATKQEDIEEEAKGPARKIAVDNDGNWSKAAVGFSKGQGKSVEDIYFKELKGVEYAYINKFIEGKKTSDLLPSFKDIILSLSFPKNMRWSDYSLRYIRPIRWIVALQDKQIIPIEIADVASDNQSYGHRFLGSTVEISEASAYVSQMRDQFVVVEPDERKDMILKGIKALEEKNNWQIAIDEDLLTEVMHLVEYPTVFSGAYGEEFLKVPEEALITSMKEHQRYFPVRSSEGKLLPFFVAVRNGDDNHIETVAKGNEKVLKARLSDARFFYDEDQKQSIERNLEKLEKIVFQEKLGTISEKVSRVVQLTSSISSLLNLDNQTKENAVRAAEISKFDLVTNMVNEFTELQGIMGEKYATLFGENERVAKAINEHYMPRHANGELPSTIEGAVVSIADKLDTIVGCFSVGIIPSGSQDPYALRRQALGILQIIQDQQWRISVDEILEVTQKLYESLSITTREKQEVNLEINEFFKQRATFVMKELGIEKDVIDAVLASGIGNLSFTINKAKVLSEKRHDPSFKNTQEALVRVLNLAAKGNGNGIKSELFENEQEKNLFEAIQNIEETYQEALTKENALLSLEKLSELKDSVHQFFDHTMVMTDNIEVKNNRLSLLNKIAGQIYKYADLTQIQWKKHD